MRAGPYFIRHTAGDKVVTRQFVKMDQETDAIRAREVAVKAVIDRALFVPIAWSPGWPRPGPSKVDRII